jgi:predicted phage-related endonuclease
LILHYKAAMLTPEQLAARKGLITSSIAGACLGLSSYKTPLQAKYTILGLDSFGGSAATERGSELEDVVLRYPARKLGLAYEPAPFRRHPNGWAADSCDALYYQAPYVADLDSPVLLGEGKTASLGMAKEFGEPGTDEVPMSAWVQAHWHLIHWPEVPRCVVPVLVGGYQFEFRLYFVERDTEIEGQLFEKLAQWHRDYIVGDKDPPAVAEDLGWLKERYSRNVDLELLGSTPEVDAIALEYRQAKLDLEDAEERVAASRARLEQYIGEHAGVETAHGKITWKSNKASPRTAWEEMAQHFLQSMPSEMAAAVMSKYTRMAPGARVFRASWKKE